MTGESRDCDHTYVEAAIMDVAEICRWKSKFRDKLSIFESD